MMRCDWVRFRGGSEMMGGLTSGIDRSEPRGREGDPSRKEKKKNDQEEKMRKREMRRRRRKKR